MDKQVKLDIIEAITKVDIWESPYQIELIKPISLWYYFL